MRELTSHRPPERVFTSVREVSQQRWKRVLIVFLAVLLTSSDPAGFSTAAADDSEISGLIRGRFARRISYRRDNGDMMRLVKPLAEQVGDSVVQVVSDGVPVALGVIVSEDGYVLTKRSELSNDPIRVRLADSRLLAARVAAVRRQSDLALLQIEGVSEPLRPVEFADEAPTEIGSFLVSVGRTGSPIGLGVVGAQSRRIEHNGRLGIVMDELQNEPTVRSVFPDSGAAVAGIKLGDRIVAIDGRSEIDRSEVIQTLRGMFPGESVRLTISREGATLDLVAKIQDIGLIQESPNDSRVNGPRSARLSGFDSVVQHDTVLNPDECGGPVIDSAGRVVGLNIARAGRVVSYALPASLVVPELELLFDSAASAAR